MKLLTDTPFRVAALPSSLMVGESCLLVVVKGTFDLVHEGKVELSLEQHPLSGDLFFDDDSARSLLYSSDFALIKPHAECFVLGHCHPEKADSVSTIAFEIGTVKKGLGVYGDRAWKSGLLGSKPSEPAPFERMPLTWERAFGGPENEMNPSGTGLIGRGSSGEGRLPNLERLDAPITAAKDRPEPISTYPISPLWRRRMQHAGTYDERWRSERYPYLPSDFDPAYFNAAPSDQIISGYWQGDEKISLNGIVPGQSIMRTHLAGYTVRAFIRRKGENTQLEDFPMVLDTITVHGDEAKVDCVWRGRIQVQDHHASDISDLYVAHELPGERASAEEFMQRMEAVEVLNHIEASGFKPRSPEHRMDVATVMLTRFTEKTQIFDKDEDALTLMKTLITQGELAKTLIRTPDAAPAANASESPAPAAPKADAPFDAPSTESSPLSGAEALTDEQRTVLSSKLGELLEKVRPVLSSPQPDSQASAAMLEAAMATLPTPEAPIIASVEPLASEPVAEPLSLTREQQVLQAHQSGATLTLDLSELVLEGQALSGLQAPSIRGRKIRCAGSDLSGANLAGAQLSNGDFASTNLERTNLEGADLSHSDLRGANLQGATLKGANLDGANLSGANLIGSVLEGATLRAANLESASLQTSQAKKADLSKANLQHSDCQEADFTDASMHGTSLQHANLQKAKLQKARLRDGAKLDGADLRYVEGEGARFVNSHLTGANFSFAKLDGADFTAATAQEITLVAASMREANFQGANLEGAAIQQCDALRSSFREAQLGGVDFRGTNLFQAEFFLAETRGISLELANVQGTRLEES